MVLLSIVFNFGIIKPTANRFVIFHFYIYLGKMQMTQSNMELQYIYFVILPFPMLSFMSHFRLTIMLGII